MIKIQGAFTFYFMVTPLDISVIQNTFNWKLIENIHIEMYEMNMNTKIRFLRTWYTVFSTFVFVIDPNTLNTSLWHYAVDCSTFTQNYNVG